jgi:hypothetical protein
MKNLWVSGICVLLCAAPALAKKKAAAAPVKQASAQTTKAIADLAGKYKWGMSHDEVMKIRGEEIMAQYDERIQKETIPSKQQAVLKQRDEELTKMKDNYVKFDGNKTGWDVSIADREFVHKNDESMFVIVEKEKFQRRFLFFWHDRLWKQFIAFGAENPAFAGLTFDDFANKIQERYGPSAMTFRKQRASDDQTLDHLEWPPSGDYVLWAIDLTTFYGNFCLVLQHKSVMGPIAKAREQNNPSQRRGSAIVDQITKGDGMAGDANADVVDEITGRQTTHRDTPAGTATTDKPAGGKKGGKPEAPPKSAPKEEGDPLDGMKF